MRGSEKGRRARSSRVCGAGFTMVEMLVALALLLAATAIALGTFWTLSQAWSRGARISNELHYGGFLLDHLAMALESTYYPDAGGPSSLYGFWLQDNGQGIDAWDAISWVKIGRTLVGDETKIAALPHRVRFCRGYTEDRVEGAAVTVWRPVARAKYAPSDEVEPIFLSTEIRGFNCRVTTNVANGAMEWRDTWDETNRLPLAVEITLYLQPLKEGEPPMEMKRLVSIPVAPLSWER